MAQNRCASHVVGVLFVVTIVAAVWVHRVYVDEPRLPAIVAADLVRHAHPTAAFLHRELNAGNLPIWNPYQMAGQPLMAFHVTGVLYPPNLLLMTLLPASRALEASTLLHLAIAGIFTWLFTGRLGLGLAARAVASAAYSLSGALLMGVYQFPCLMVEAWLPAIMWSVHGLASEARLRWGLALTLILGHAFLGGYAQGLLYELMLGVSYGVLSLFAVAQPEQRLRVATIAGASGLLTLGLVAPQLLPTLELTSQSVRNLEGIPYGLASFFAATPAILLESLWGPWADAPAEAWSPLRWRLSLPLLFLPLLVLGVRVKALRSQWIFFLLAFGLAGLFTLGANSFVFPLFYALPLGDLFRGPIYMAFVYAFLAAVLLAIGMEGLANQLRRSKLASEVMFGIAAAVASLVCLDIYSRTSLDVRHPVVSNSIGAPKQLIKFLSSRLGRERIFIQPFDWDAGIRFKLGMANGVFAVPDYESNSPSAYAEYFDQDARSWHGELSVLGRVYELAALVPPALLDLMSVRYYASKRSSDRGIPERLLNRTRGTLLRAEGLWLVERAAALPRVYTVSEVLREPDDQSVLARLRSDSFRPREQVVLRMGEGDTGGLSATAGSPVHSESAANARVIFHQTEQVEIEARCRAECLLVLTDLHYPGWEVSVDGEQAEMLRVNSIFRGVLLAPGKHEVVYRFRPASFQIGLLLAAASLLVIALCATHVAVVGRDQAPDAAR